MPRAAVRTVRALSNVMSNVGNPGPVEHHREHRCAYPAPARMSKGERAVAIVFCSAALGWTPPNAIVFSYEEMKLGDMVKAGFWLIFAPSWAAMSQKLPLGQATQYVQ